jgi:hypothetical protein
MLKAGEGKIKYIDFSSSDPHGGLNKVINAALLSDGPLDAVKDGLIQAIEPFVGEEITARATLGLYSNEDAYGRQIWNPEASKAEQIYAMLAYAMKVAEPGTVTSLKRVGKSDTPWTEIGAALSGFRVTEVDVEEQFGFKINNSQKRAKDAKSIYNKAFYNEKSTSEDIESAYEQANNAMKEIYGELSDVYQSAERLGVAPEKLAIKLKDGGISIKNIEQIQTGEILDLDRKDKENSKGGRTPRSEQSRGERSRTPR